MTNRSCQDMSAQVAHSPPNRSKMVHSSHDLMQERRRERSCFSIFNRKINCWRPRKKKASINSIRSQHKHKNPNQITHSTTMPTNTSSDNGDRDDEIFVENVPSPPVAEVANGAADDDSLSSEKLMACGRRCCRGRG